MSYDQFSDTLCHIGNKNSGRYPRGSGENPFQHIKRVRAEKRARKEEAEREKKRIAFEKRRAKFLKGRDPYFLEPAYVFKHREYFTTQELQSINTRCKAIDEILKYSKAWPNEKKAGNKFLDNVNKAIKIADSAEATLDKFVKVIENPAFQSIASKLGFDYSSAVDATKNVLSEASDNKQKQKPEKTKKAGK